MQVIPNGIDCDKFRPDPEARARIRSKWNIAPEVPLVGLVGRIDPMKDHRTFLEAVARTSRTDYVAVCVGGGADRVFEPLRTLARELDIHDRLHFVGAEGDMPGVYAALDILVSASIGEGFSNVIAEAMACGVPAVVTDVGDSAEIVGSTGIVVPPRSPDALARGMEDLLDRRGPELSARARQRIVTNFTVDLMVDHTRSLLQALR
jgi:glycosyltransferase involved in cell wall biosynthesis